MQDDDQTRSDNDADLTQSADETRLEPSNDPEATRTEIGSVDEVTALGAATARRPAPAGLTQLGVGDTFAGRYQILSQLGAGGMGMVYKAWDQTLNVVVAVKIIRPDAMRDPRAAADIERRFKQELLLARQVTHRNVVRIHDLGDIGGMKYITMSFVEGDDLSTILRREETLPVARVLPLARQIAAGLEAAHEAGVVHRDLKPANIMVDADGHALIMDFGIAVQGGGRSRPDRKTGTTGASESDGAVIGTLEYMSPEQSKGESVDHRTDIYAFGLILTDLLLGRRTPEPGKSAWETLTDRISKPPQPLAARAPDVAADFDAVVTRCLQLSPADRFETTSELVAALGRLDDEGVNIPEPKRLTPRMMAAAAVTVGALLGGTWWFARGPAIQPTEPVSRGSRFTVEWNVQGVPDAEEASAQAATVAVLTPAAAHSPKILVAEDNPVNQLVVTQMLRRLGYTADVVNDGEAAVAAVATVAYDLVLMDVQMPNMDGLSATRMIRGSTGKQPRIIAMTANAMPGDREVCIDAGMDDYLPKPLNLDALGAAIVRNTSAAEM
jgi:CheY-like chemotaxis protein/tRNA A-37 threonylcarbamoyl transferase component Bud32